MLKFFVAESLTGRIIGRLHPSEWSWTDPLTGSAEGSFTVPIPQDAEQVQYLIDLTRPHIRQVCAQDDQGRWWFGGPILADAERATNDTVIIPVGDWRAWFYAAPIRPNTDGTRREYLRLQASSNQVEQNQAIADLATIGLDTVGKPRLVVDTPVSSTVMRDVTARMFKLTGAAMDNVSRRHNGPDWWTYIATDPADSRNVVAHLAIAHPERSLLSSPMVLRREVVVLRGQLGKGGNILTYTWPRGTPPPSRVISIGSDPPPDEKWAIAEDPELLAGTRLAWDEVWQLPDGIVSPESAFEHAIARLTAHGNDLGVIEVVIDPAATDLGSWGPGDRTRMIVADGWRDVELEQARILSRTLTGRGEHVTGVTAAVNLSAVEVDIDEPDLEGEA